jgi:GTP-binding protein YchF
MRLGLIGLPMSGKTTVFNVLTGSDRPASAGVPGKLDVQLAVVSVPDPRLDALHALYVPRKKVEAQIAYADVGGLAKGVGSTGLSGPFRNELNQMDGFLHVVRAFENPGVPHPEGDIDPQRDLDILEAELILADLLTAENRVEHIQDEMSKGKDREINARRLALFERLREALEGETPLHKVGLSETEEQDIKGYGFLTTRPRLVLLNMGDEAQEPGEVIQAAEGTPVLAIQGALEMEIAQLEPDEAALFMDEYGIAEPMRERVIRESYQLLNVQTFFTIGDEEVRAWTFPAGATAQEAAGIIHTDMERGFIRAEIVPIGTLLEMGGMAEVREAGKLRLEGKDYVMQDGDVMFVRFAV